MNIEICTRICPFAAASIRLKGWLWVLLGSRSITRPVHSGSTHLPTPLSVPHWLATTYKSHPISPTNYLHWELLMRGFQTASLTLGPTLTQCWVNVAFGFCLISWLQPVFADLLAPREGLFQSPSPPAPARTPLARWAILLKPLLISAQCRMPPNKGVFGK